MSFLLNIQEWESYLSSLLNDYLIYAPIRIDKFSDFKVIENNFKDIVYNSAKTITSLKNFLFPIKEKVTNIPPHKNLIIIGAKACDLVGLDILDKVFLEPEFPDPYYNFRRENILIIGTDCYEIDESCHCNIYGINPYPERNCDLILNLIDDRIFLESLSKKGEKFISNLKKELKIQDADEKVINKIENKRNDIKQKLQEKNKSIPDYDTTRDILKNSIGKKDKVWKEYAEKCVACGACSICCPTCHCFILLDIPDNGLMEKIRSQDSCQYPGFEKVAAGIDPLEKHFVRFRNRYICKFINRPEKFDTIACTGCGRCIDTCIGKINKNDVIKSLAQ